MKAVPVPRVTTNELSPSLTMRNAWATPTNRLTPMTTANAYSGLMWSCIFITPMITRSMLNTPATDRSKSPEISETTKASDSTSRTAWESNIVWKFDRVRKVPGLMAPKTMMMTTHTPTTPNRLPRLSQVEEVKRRGRAGGAGGAGGASDSAVIGPSHSRDSCACIAPWEAGTGVSGQAAGGRGKRECAGGIPWRVFQYY